MTRNPGEGSAAWSLTLVARALAIGAAAVFAGAVAGHCAVAEPKHHDDHADAAPPPREANEVELAFVAPLRPGTPFEGWIVRAVQGVDDGVLRVVLAREGAEVRLDVALAGGAIAPPAAAGAYGVYYSARPELGAEAERLAKALADLVEKRDASSSPPGIGTFSPKPRPGDLL